jgi:hypothetical protein
MAMPAASQTLRAGSPMSGQLPACFLAHHGRFAIVTLLILLTPQPRRFERVGLVIIEQAVHQDVMVSSLGR